jgi:hypothetical protein
MQFQFMQFQMANAIKNVFASFASNFSYRSSCILLYMNGNIFAQNKHFFTFYERS